MKQRHIWLLVLALVAGAALLTATAAASAAAILGNGDQPVAAPQLPPPPPPPPLPGRGGAGLDRLVFDLDLTQAQIEQVKALRDAAHSASRPYEEQVRKADESIRAAVESGTFDEEAVRALAAGQSKAMIELRVIQARTDAGILKLLTAEQRETLKNLRPPRPGRGRGEMFE